MSGRFKIPFTAALAFEPLRRPVPCHARRVASQRLGGRKLGEAIRLAGNKALASGGLAGQRQPKSNIKRPKERQNTGKS